MGKGKKNKNKAEDGSGDASVNQPQQRPQSQPQQRPQSQQQQRPQTQPPHEGRQQQQGQQQQRRPQQQGPPGFSQSGPPQGQQQQRPQQQQRQQGPQQQGPPGFSQPGPPQQQQRPRQAFQQPQQQGPPGQPQFPGLGQPSSQQPSWGQPQVSASGPAQRQQPAQAQGQPHQPRQQQVPQGLQSGPPQGQQQQQGPPQATHPPQSQEPAQAQGQPQQAQPKKKGNKYPKKEQPQPSAAPTQSAAGAIQKPMQQLQLSPTKSLAMIESAPNGAVYEGKRGRPVNLEVNYLAIAISKLIPKAYHYDVEFVPDIPKKMLSKALDTFMQTHFPKVAFAFDGRKNVYTNQLLAVKGVTLDGQFEQEVLAVLGDRQKNFKVKVQFATEIDMRILNAYQNPAHQHDDKPSQAIQCLDVILRTVFKQLTANNRAVAVGRALYFAEGNRNLGEGMELWLGLFQSAILGRRALFLNVDVAHKAFPSSVSLLQVLASFDRDGRIPNQIDRRMEERLKDYLKMLSISYKLNPNDPPKTFGFNGLVTSARNATFVKEDGTKMTVLEYYKREKGITLQYPDFPCLHVGSKIRNIYLPLELCGIPAGQATNKKCTPNCVAAMIKYSATSTDERKQKIQNLLGKINYVGGDLEGFGVGVDKKFQNVGGRVINPPDIKYARRTVQPRNGVWNGDQFIDTQAAKIKWGIINCDDRTNIQAVKTLAGDIMKGARTQGMQLEDITDWSRDYKPCNDLRDNRLLDRLLSDFKIGGYKLVFVIIVDRFDNYAKVKQLAELKVDILTQCIKSNTVFRMGKGNPMMTIGNILLKVNAKLGGKNHEVLEESYLKYNSLSDGVMFVGADVTHPSPDQRDIPSVVGVAASHDQVGFRYQCAWRLQDPKKEMIEDLENILTDQLIFYKNKNKKLPGKIFYYRDGVSDGQFAEVLTIEMSAIRAAMKRVYGQSSHAKVTFVVCQKRHHTRFFPTEPNKDPRGNRNNNIAPGTVVDKDIVHPFQYQFFLASHAAIQGVTKPTKYCVLVNESKISPDDLQAITYDLCHLFTRCNRSVSYPAPTYYAHLVAARGKQYTIGQRLDMRNLQREFAMRSIRPDISNNCPMFFV